MTQLNKSQRLKSALKKTYKHYYVIRLLPIVGGGRVVVSEGVVKLVEWELVLLMEELKVKDCGAGVSNVENLKK